MLIYGTPLNDSLTGTSEGDVIIGLDGFDRLFGLDGNDVLVGGEGEDELHGGTGANELIGGTFNDRYFVASLSDTIVEFPFEGTDQITTSTNSYVLPANVELLAYSGASSFVGIGNSGYNSIVGGPQYDEIFGLDGDDFLVGGALVPDALLGGQGNDIYVVSVRGDSTLEGVNEGIDEVRTELGVYALQDNVENLRFSPSSGVLASSGTHVGIGNALNNVIWGGVDNNELFGRAGDDTLHGGYSAASALFGGSGNDTYILHTFGDSIIESVGEGYDVVESWGATVVVMPQNVERLSFAFATSNLGIGNDSDNLMIGGAGVDELHGGVGNDIIDGNLGADSLFGDAGADVFRYGSLSLGIDRIYDFTSGVDKIGFMSPGVFAITPFALVQGSGLLTPTSANSTFLYDSATGALSYDQDGTGPIAAIQFAMLNAGLILSASDFVTM